MRLAWCNVVSGGWHFYATHIASCVALSYSMPPRILFIDVEACWRLGASEHPTCPWCRSTEYRRVFSAEPVWSLYPRPFYSLYITRRKSPILSVSQLGNNSESSYFYIASFVFKHAIVLQDEARGDWISFPGEN